MVETSTNVARTRVAVGDTFTANTAAIVRAEAGTVVTTAKFAVYLTKGNGITAPSVAGTYGVKITPAAIGVGALQGAVAQNLTITVSTAATASTTPDVTTSKVYLQANGASGAHTPVADSSVIVSKEIASTPAGFVYYSSKNAASGSVVESLTAEISGQGTLGLGNTGTPVSLGRSITVRNGDTVTVWADGSAGKGTITIKGQTSGVTLGTKTVTFYGSAAKYTATTVLNALSDGSTTRDAVVVCATDAAGIAVPSSTIYAFSGDATVASVETSDSTVSAAVTEDKDGSAGTAIAPASYVAAKAIGCAGFSVTGLAQATKSSVTLTFGNASTLALSDVTTTAVVKVGAAQAASIALSTDKATYAPGEKMTITLTYTDAYGRSVGAGPGTGTLAAALTSSASLTGDALFATANNSKLGVTSITAYAPLTQGTVLLSGLTGTNATYLATAIRGIALSASVKVVDANQSSLLTQIDALNAKIVALNALIAKIMKKLGVK
jgi:hypothetical protein